ncbi:alpha/beta-hydrolase [Mollisia scopiformis]|uniref:Alpha/beta-hydrolase n=1 Tax=Mollisia scopiformis TaxID=149040 RepID=A0A194X0N7_MOLSC|nr:alpha/beta-hydrolase [Mollisia scopiformis]KUJ13755.1 alpha/beta-hydrolase [Mollisia scopiformis]
MTVPIPALSAAEREKYDIFFPPLPNYGPPTLGKRFKWAVLRIGPPRPFQQEEERRAEEREKEERKWERQRDGDVDRAILESHGGWCPSEGGRDKMIRDVGYYARRVGLDCEELKVQTEDGHILVLWHVYDPREYIPLPAALRGIRGPESIDAIRPPSRKLEPQERGQTKEEERRYPILMIHGLLQSAGVYATNDEHSLAFWLCKEGFDVWLGNCRAGFTPEHVELDNQNPEMWNWDLRHMATLDLPALTARVLSETSFSKLALVGHSQGTTATLIALSRFSRPSLSSKLSVACLLAPAFYAASLLTTKFVFRFMRLIPLSAFTLLFGRTSFIPVMGKLGYLHGKVPENWIGGPSYAAYRFLFNWTDQNWDRGRGTGAMAWWLGRGGFADRDCVLSIKEELERENIEDLLEDFEKGATGSINPAEASTLREKLRKDEEKGFRSECWFPEYTAPLAFWAAGDDELVDGKRLLNRFRRGREPNANIVHKHVVAGYEHLDVVWSCDAVEKVGWEMRNVIWKSVQDKSEIRNPRGCVDI